MQEIKIATLEIKVDGLYDKLEEFENSQKKFNTHLEGEIHKISRGLYGDEQNQNKGLIDRLIEVEKRVSELEDDSDTKEIKENTVSKVFAVTWKITASIIMIWLTFKQVVGVDSLLNLIK
jgi:hypothetical protein